MVIAQLSQDHLVPRHLVLEAKDDSDLILNPPIESRR
jgi:hypothetical protein